MSKIRSGSTPESLPLDLPEVLLPLHDDLALVQAKYQEILSNASWRSRDMVDQAASFRGKRLRPALTCLAARLAGKGTTPDVATVAAIIELIHTATLIHDDILDGADVRRKVATLNARWGDKAAVLVGDVLFSKAYRAAAYLEDRFASCYLSDVVAEILEGEIHQDLVARNVDLTQTEYRRIIRGKTAALYEAALRVGSRYGGGDEALEKKLGIYGHHLGMAFQIIDDRLDLTGDETTVGKSLGRDLREGKTTLPLILWLSACGPSERPEARALVERAWDEPDAAQEVSKRVAASGALELADEVARQEIRRGLAQLDGVEEGVERDLLELIGKFVLSRAL